MGADHNTASLTTLADLASARVGGRAVATNDEFFAPRSNLLKPERAISIPGKFTTRGKWMDGWETRRRRTPGHDWCVIALGMRGVIRGVNVDTSYFTGNFPSHCSIDAIDSGRTLSAAVCAAAGAPWTTLLQRSELRGNGENVFPIDDRPPVDARTAEHLSGRRRGAAPRARRRVRRLENDRATQPDGRPRGNHQRRPRPPRERHALRRARTT